MKKTIMFVVVAMWLLQLALVASAKTEPITVTGWVSDENCGAAHTKPGGEDCVLKCLRGGAHVGHPEWKAQRMVFVTDEGQQIWVVVNPKALKGFEGKHVTITGSLHVDSKKIRVRTANEVKTT